MVELKTHDASIRVEKMKKCMGQNLEAQAGSCKNGLKLGSVLVASALSGVSVQEQLAASPWGETFTPILQKL